MLTSRFATCAGSFGAQSSPNTSLRKLLASYSIRKLVRRNVFDYIEMIYNLNRHSYANDVSPVEFERQYFTRLRSV